MSLGVVYLSRHANPRRYFLRFLQSLAEHGAGVPYDLIVIQKGYPEAAKDPALDGFTAPGLQRILVFHASDETFATNVFFDVAGAYDHDHLLYFVSWSRVLAPDWGRLMLGAYDAVPACGVVGASSGWEALNETTPFPNPSIRTTGFLIERALFAALDFRDRERKYGGNLFEAGPDSMTRQIERRGLVPVVADRFGHYWLTADWPKSRTFRSGDQEGLIFADNRTHAYDAGSNRKRRKLARLNWGDDAMVTGVDPLRRLWRRFVWSYR
ncbi:hypothetical protein L2U69_17810 [Zavarzinia compransoris]|uniref:hypothetical protein n=1 Tax=Zavarzinia marina TaxID=2911065 RepID=UPI001F328F8E|nr:hypothetical protein [Zavarzinia marina]MCF4167507.1 hypothetical protein [Zavarzinia marina]